MKNFFLCLINETFYCTYPCVLYSRHMGAHMGLSGYIGAHEGTWGHIGAHGGTPRAQSLCCLILQRPATAFFAHYSHCFVVLFCSIIHASTVKKCDPTRVAAVVYALYSSGGHRGHAGTRAGTE